MGVFDFVSDVVVLLLVALRRFKLEVVGYEEVDERLKKVGMLVIDGKGSVVRFEGRLLIISEGLTVGSVVSPADVVSPRYPVGVKELVAGSVADSPVADIVGSGVLADRLVSWVTDEATSDGV